MALHAALIERPRLREHMLAIEMGERLDLAVERLPRPRPDLAMA